MIRKKTYIVTVNVPDECNFEDVLKSAFAYGWVPGSSPAGVTIFKNLIS